MVDRATRELREEFRAGKTRVSRRICTRFRFGSGDFVWLNVCAVMDPETQLAFGLSMENSMYVEQQATLVDLLAELGEDMTEPLAAIRVRLDRLALIPGLAANADMCARLACVEHSCATLEGARRAGRGLVGPGLLVLAAAEA